MKDAVSGGTGYAVEMAIQAGKPVYLFDQRTNKWYANTDGTWVESNTPVLTKNFAGIGSRNISQEGINAIKDVYEKTFATKEEVKKERVKPQYYTGDITPDENTIFVFGSNPVGINGNPVKGTGGAALIASKYFGVKQGEKMDNKLSDSGMAYGLTTVTYPGRKRSMTPTQITDGIKKLYEVAKQNPDKQFKIAYRNVEKMSLNGYTGLEMINMFNNAGTIPSNIIFSEEWFNTGKLNLEIKEEVKQPRSVS